MRIPPEFDEGSNVQDETANEPGRKLDERQLQSCSCPFSSCSNDGYCASCSDYAAVSAKSPGYELDYRVAAKNPWGINAVPPIVNQGACGSCWAFAITAGMDIHNYNINRGGGLVKYSEQLILDCAPSTCASGCRGAATNCVAQWMASSGIKQMLNSDYPYTAKKSTCKINAAKQKNC